MTSRRVSDHADVVGHTLVICEKPDAARRVAEALSSGGPPEVLSARGVTVYRLEGADRRSYVVCAAMGHLYGIGDTMKNRRVYPALDLEWSPLVSADRRVARLVSDRIDAIRSFAKNARAFVNACDFDVEGDTIGYNILKYACEAKEASVLRARFSSLTGEEVVEAFDPSRLGSIGNGGSAGRLRHAIDFVWGVNLSRALSEPLRTVHGFRTMSIGRVQGPTLNFVVAKEVEVRSFVPAPYWTVRGAFRKGEVSLDARYKPAVVRTRRAAERVKEECEGRAGTVYQALKRRSVRPPPPPFNLADLQKESFRSFGYQPTKTLQLAERLYLGAMISYPRTGSQRLPKLDYARLLAKLADVPGWSEPVGRILARGSPRPSEGKGTDSAHPAIFPTGEGFGRRVSIEERNIFDLVVRRFLQCFGEEAVLETASVEISVGQHRFELEESRVLSQGWMGLISGRPTKNVESGAAPGLMEGDLVTVDRVEVEEHMSARPARYDQASLLERMEREEIGTKSTRAETISTLLVRGYVEGRELAPTELGLALIDAMHEFCPQIISTGLTRDVEVQLERMEGQGDLGVHFFEETMERLVAQVGELRSKGVEVADRMGGSAPKGVQGRMVLGRCLLCKDGELWVVRSRKSGKRFVGCTNYSKGCAASAPLPQKGAVKATSKMCGKCGWPVACVRLGRRSWKLCVNDRCPSKVNVYSMQKLQK